MKEQRKAMGSGVEALFQNVGRLQESQDSSKITVQMLPISRIRPNHNQPRKLFETEALEELAESIKQYGILQPIIVKAHAQEGGSFEIVAGERRYRAALLLGLKELPVIVHDLPTKEAFVVALIENMQREALNPIEEAKALMVLKEDFGLTQEELGKSLGKSRPAIANTIRLMNLPTTVQQLLIDKDITVGHARILLSVDDAELQKEYALLVKEHALSVRQLEVLIKQRKDNARAREKRSRKTMITLKNIEKTLKERSMYTVKICGTEEKGKITLSYNTKAELEAIVALLEMPRSS